jgi:hypothetical protein
MNVMNGFNQVISEFVDVHILQTLVNFLNKDKGCSVSIDELRTALQLTVVTPAPSPMRAPMAGVQPPLLSNFVPTAVHSGRGTKKDKVPPGARLCQYQFGKGKNVGKTCGEVYGELAVEGSDRCKNCIDKGVGKKEKGTTKDAPASSSADGALAPTVPNPSNSTTPPDQGELQVYPCKDQPGVFKTLQHGFIVKQIDQHHIVATGIEDAATGKARALTDAEKKIAYDLGIAVVDSDTPRAVPSSAPATPAAPVPPTVPVAQSVIGTPPNPSVPMVPTIPSLPSSAGAKPIANVTIPSFPNLNVPTLPKSTIMSVPSQPVAGLVIPKM